MNIICVVNSMKIRNVNRMEIIYSMDAVNTIEIRNENQLRKLPGRLFLEKDYAEGRNSQRCGTLLA